MGLKVKDPNGAWRSTGGGGGSKPNLPLQFTGAVEAIYDGSKAVTVEIPEGGGGGESNLLVVTLKTENGNYVSSHTYQEIKEFTDNGGDAVLCEEGETASFFPLASVSSTQAFFGKQAFLGQLFVSQGYYIKADGTVTLDQQMIEIPEGGASITVDDALSPDSTNPVQNKVIFAYLEEATNVLEQIQGSIPSDDHINELIDEYLSEALGGDY